MSETKQLESVGLVVEKLKSMHEKDQMVIISGIMNDGVHRADNPLNTIIHNHSLCLTASSACSCA